jgi:hypothetical protein
MIEKFKVLTAAVMLLMMVASCDKKEPEIIFVPELSVAPATVDVVAAADSYTLTVTSNMKWTVTGKTSWLRFDPVSGTGNGTITVNVAKNIDLEPRTGAITVTAVTPAESVTTGTPAESAVTLTKSITVNQEAATPDVIEFTCIPRHFEANAIKFSIEGRDLTIDWGDGSIEEIYYYPSNPISHKYGNNAERTVRIEGLEVRTFDCNDQYMTRLDISNCPSLRFLDCRYNSFLTSLVTGKNKSLNSLWCYYTGLTSLDVSGMALSDLRSDHCKFDAAALNAIFTDLLDLTGLSIRGYISTYNNPGSEGCDPSIATAKNWEVLN